MTIDAETINVIERKAALYDAAKERVVGRIREYAETAMDSLRAAEAELLDFVEIEFGENPFSEFLSTLGEDSESDNNPLNNEVRTILSKEIRGDFGPDEETFNSLLSAIDSFKSQHRKMKRMLFDSTPRDLRCSSATCSTISVLWERVECDCFYEIELKSQSTVTTHRSLEAEYTFRGLRPETEYIVRVRAVMTQDNSPYLWSDPITAETEWGFSDCGWKECPDDVFDERKYELDPNNTRIATKIGVDYCAIKGDIIPLNKTASWNIKILRSRKNNGQFILIGIAPFDIDQNEKYNFKKCGWYIDCYGSTLCSGPPHSYPGKEYGPRKEDGQYVHTEDSVGVLMDTTKGELSFVLNGVNCGVAYEGIPLDKPLVPCVLLKDEDDSIEFIPLGEKENDVDSSIPVPSNITTKNTTWDSITLTWDAVDGASFYQIEVDGNKFWDASTTNKFTKRGLLPDTDYIFRVRTVRGNSVSEWSGIAKRKTLKELLENSGWKEYNDYQFSKIRYSVDKDNIRIASKINDYANCTIIGNTLIPFNQVSSWSIKILKSKDNNGRNIWIGVAPFDVSLNENDNSKKCGWYLNCYDSTLRSGPPHNYRDKRYGPMKDNAEHIHNGDRVGVVMDTTKGSLSFSLNGVNLGVAYEGIPLDKPLVPCVLLKNEEDSIELDTSEVKENMDSSIPVPSNITAKSGTTWDSITLTWGDVEGASFYQIEVDESKSWEVSTTNKFTKRGLLPETEHSFRVRSVKGNTVGEWGAVVKGRTEKESFETSRWKECPGHVIKKRKYSVYEENPRIISKNTDDDYCTIIGNTPLSPNKVTSWNIKILKSKDDNGDGIFIGVAPSDIDQNESGNYDKCGWYFNCYDSTLRSGPPHNYKKRYGPWKERGGYVHTGDSVGVVMDTAKGELSFVVNGVNYGIAYEGIPLGKPLVPCALLGKQGDSVELDTSEVKENMDSSIPFPSNITAKSGITWDSITLTWDAVEGASFYQFEVDGSKSWDASATNTFTKRGLLPETEHTFRVRVAKENSVGEWSCVVKRRTQKKSFEYCWWKNCPDNVDWSRRYSADEENPRIATKNIGDDYCTIIGNTPLPLNKVTSWWIKLLKSKDNDGGWIYIGVAPSDINQNISYDNYNKYGWYLDCYDSRLFSGRPHNRKGKMYGPRKGEGQYVHTEDRVGVVMDTTKGELSFVLKGVNHGVAYEGIPLDKPLVPCVILRNQWDSIELTPCNMNNSISTPSNVVTNGGNTWDSITITWDVVEGASFYQIEVDGDKLWSTKTNSFGLRGFLPETEHTFRVRAVRWNSASRWSDVARGRTQKAPFKKSGWKECPDNVDENRKYFVDKNNPKVARKIGNGYCTIIGNTPLPLNKVTSWSIKILKSRDNDRKSNFIELHHLT